MEVDKFREKKPCVLDSFKKIVKQNLLMRFSIEFIQRNQVFFPDFDHFTFPIDKIKRRGRT